MSTTSVAAGISRFRVDVGLRAVRWSPCPLLAGAIQDRQQRLERLIGNSLVAARRAVSMAPAAPGMGTRYRVDADAHGVSIRNANIQDLVAIVYGVNRYCGDHAADYSRRESASRTGCTRRDTTFASGPGARAGDFDPYALRQRLTSCSPSGSASRST